MNEEDEVKESWGETLLNWIGDRFQNPLWRDFIMGAGAGTANTSAVDAAVRNGVRRSEPEPARAAKPAAKAASPESRETLIRKARLAAGLSPDVPLNRRTIRELQLAIGLDGASADGLW